MKKIISALLLSVLFCSGLFAKENIFSFNLGVCTGLPVYGDKALNSESGNRIIAGGMAGFTFNIVENAAFFVSADLMYDTSWEGDLYANHLSYDFPFGIKFYPHLGDICLGLAYVIGSRTDYYKTSADTKAYSSSNPWGNGLKLIFEYNFSHSMDYYIPAIGCFWKLMPRGNKNWDNIIGFYLQAVL